MTTKGRYWTPQGRLSKIYTKMQERALHKGIPLMLRDAFMAWAHLSPEYPRIFDAWVSSDFAMRLTPTVDRIDFKEGYVMGNIQFLTHSENVSKGNRETDRRGHKPCFIKKVMLSKDNQSVIFDSGKQASLFLGLNQRAVAVAICNGYRVGGWEASYV